MPRFRYSARDASGRSLRDELEAPARRDAMRVLAEAQAEGLSATLLKLVDDRDVRGDPGSRRAGVVRR
jgi:type II secretory pathway component PulF